MSNFKSFFPYLTTTALQHLIYYINSFEVGSIIYRKNLTSFNGPLGSSYVDNYRNYLTKAGYLEIVLPGAYRIIKHIPDINTTELLQQAYHK